MPRPVSPVPDWVPPDLPKSPGVYEFLDRVGTVIYVGKSVNLRRRIRGYFYGGGPADPAKKDMLRLSREVRIRQTGSDLEALLDEAETIGALRPAFNRVHKNRSRAWYIEVDWSIAFPRLRVVAAPRKVKAEYLGPYRGRRIPEDACRLVEKIYRLRSCPGRIRPDTSKSPCLQYGMDQCTAPCVGLIGLDEYRGRVRRAVETLRHGSKAESDRAVLEGILSRGPRRESDALGLRRRREWFDELASYRPALRALPIRRSLLIALPAHGGGHVLVPVARGRVLPRQTVRPEEAEKQIRDACYAVRVAELRAEDAFPVEALTLTLLVERWLRSRPEPGRVFLLDHVGADEVVPELLSA